MFFPVDYVFPAGCGFPLRILWASHLSHSDPLWFDPGMPTEWQQAAHGHRWNPHDLSPTLWAPLSMTQTLWSWGADSFWKMSARKSVNLTLMRTRTSEGSLYYQCFWLTGHRDQPLRGKRLLATRCVHSSDRLHILRDKTEAGSGFRLVKKTLYFQARSYSVYPGKQTDASELMEDFLDESRWKRHLLLFLLWLNINSWS